MLSMLPSASYVAHKTGAKTLISDRLSPHFTSVSMATVCSQFILNDRKIYEHSALSMHCYIEHKKTFNF